MILNETERVLQKNMNAFITHTHHPKSKNLGQGIGWTLKQLNSYSKLSKNTIYVAKDSRLLSDIFIHKVLTYHKLTAQLLESNFMPSFSFMINKTKTSSLTKKISLHQPISQSLQIKNVDFTEDEYMRDDISQA
jgi:hypothetical protein